MLMEPPMLPPHYRIFLETLVNNLVVLYLRISGGIACYKQEFGLSKTGHGLDDVVLDLVPKHLTLLRLLLDVDVLSEGLRFSVCSSRLIYCLVPQEQERIVLVWEL